MLFHIIPRYSKLFHGIPLYSILFRAIPSYSMVFNCIPWYSTLFQAIPWYPIVFHATPSYSMVLHCIPWYSMLFQAIPWYSIASHGIPCYSKLFHVIHVIPLLRVIAAGTRIEKMGLQESPRGNIQGKSQESQNRQQNYVLHYMARDQPQACVPIAYCVRSGFAPNRQSLVQPATYPRQSTLFHVMQAIPLYSILSLAISCCSTLFHVIPSESMLFHVIPC